MIIEITRAQAMCMAALQEHKDVTEKVSIYHKEPSSRWVQNAQCGFSFIPFGIDGNDPDAIELLKVAKECLSKVEYAA